MRRISATALTLLIAQSAAAQCTLEVVPKPYVGPAPATTGLFLAGVGWDPDGPAGEPELTVLGGMFSEIGTQPVANLAAWDGQQWHDVGGGVGGGQVQALEVWNQSLVVLGSFSSAGSSSADGIAIWDGTAWSIPGSGTIKGVFDDAVVDDDNLVVTGQFEIAGAPATLAQWNGQAWTAMSAAIPHASQLVVYQGVLHGLIGTKIHTWSAASGWAALSPAPNFPVVRIVASTQALHAIQHSGGYTIVSQDVGSGGWVQYSPFLGTVHSAMPYLSGILMGGTFEVAAGPWPKVVGGLAYWNGGFSNPPAGKFPSLWTAQLVAGSSQRTLVVARGSNTSSASPKVIMQLSSAGWKSTLAGQGPWGTVHAVEWEGENPIIAGEFSLVAGIPATNVARWDGSSWIPMSTPHWRYIPADLAWYKGDLIVAGRVETEPSNSWDDRWAARWDGNAWVTLPFSGSGIGSLSFSTLAVKDGNLYAGGSGGLIGWNGVSKFPVGQPLVASGGPPSVGSIAFVAQGMAITGSFLGGVPGVEFKSLGLLDATGWKGIAVPPTALGYHNAIAFNDTLHVLRDSATLERWDGATWDIIGTAPPTDPPWSMSTLFVWDEQPCVIQGRYDAQLNKRFYRVDCFDGTGLMPRSELIGPNSSWLWGSSVSPTGRTVLLYGGSPQSGTPAALLALECPCPGDCDSNAVLNVFDYLCFGNHYNAGSPKADCDSNGVLNILDFICFSNAYAAGCP